MRVPSFRPVAVAATTLALGAGIVAGAASAHAATTPPWEPDGNAVPGASVTFYDAAGNVVTSGPSDGAFAAYAVASKHVLAGGASAQVLFANPSASSPTYNWHVDQPGTYTKDPITGGPANLVTASKTQPVAAISSDDETLEQAYAGFTHDSTTGYANIIQIRITEAPAVGQADNSKYAAADVAIDTTTHTWTQVFPAPVTATVPAAPTSLAATAGSGRVSLTWAAPKDDGGSAITAYAVQYQATGAATWTPVERSGTATSQTVTGLANGTGYLFRVAAVNAQGQGPWVTSSTVTPLADASTLSISATRSIVAGRSGTVGAVLKDAVTKSAVAGQTLTLKQRTSAKSSWTTAGTAKTSSTGSVSLAVKPGATRQYEWVYAGSPTHRAVTSSVATVTVAQSLTIAADHASVRHTGSVRVYGALNPAVTGRKVTIQRKVGSSWKTVVTVTVKKQKMPNGRTYVGYLAPVKLTAKGSYTFRAYAPATATPLAAGYSSAVTVKST